ncbi:MULTISPECIES: MarR family winged helix-turn-helix transcriptional regulator [Pseudomonas aeruginosa group]|uniref:MarR family winged helix-turn-helix transcriptional regulator n=1 Tax=Pseudomonas aeruginosa group TaxID=136841 RepID=UPI001F3E2DC9|nr:MULTISPECIES: MarR family transcriptional regulator [Pseudomonas aeruginosa group]MCP1650148.1 DNA-binding MarR family transcriptional regulator [Pseudomonas nitroreducens]MCP1687982.1 DNA-binding MarR family transcriptional regulator [Pseudomonas nitroreducens]
MDRAAFAIEQWRQQLPELDTDGMLLLGRLGEAAQLIARDHLNPLFAEFGLQPGEFDVLATLRRSGAPFRLTPTVLYEAAMISSGSMTNRLDRLEKQGLVQRMPNPEDGRGSLVGLSEAGLALIDQAVGAHADNQRRVLSGLSASEQEQLAGLLEKLLASLPATER